MSINTYAHANACHSFRLFIFIFFFEASSGIFRHVLVISYICIFTFRVLSILVFYDFEMQKSVYAKKYDEICQYFYMYKLCIVIALNDARFNHSEAYEERERENQML